MSKKTAAEWIAQAIGPRRVGGHYWDGYWNREYIVEHIELHVPIWDFLVTVRWPDGHKTTHCTPWDTAHDRVICQPLNQP